MNWNQGRFPSLHHRKEGCLRHQENVAQQPKPTQPGWFSFCFQSENHPVRANAEASRYFLDRTATPPCGDARRGVSLDSNSFTPSMTTATVLPDYITAGRLELGAGRFLFERRTRDAGRTTVLNHRSDREVIDAEIGMLREVLG